MILTSKEADKLLIISDTWFNRHYYTTEQIKIKIIKLS